MPAPEILFPVAETPAGRRIYKDEAEASINEAFRLVWALIEAIPAGPEGPRGPVGLTGDRWIVGPVRQFEEGLVVVPGNAVVRRYSGAQTTTLFRALQNTTTSLANFPSSPAGNAAWEVIMNIPDGARGPQGERGLQGLQGVAGDSSEIVEFATDTEAQAYSAANPLALVISSEGM